MSDTDILIEFVFEDEFILKASLNRVKGPLIIEDIKVKIPFDSRTAFLRGEMKILLGISKGNLKPVKIVERGDIAYMPLGDSLCIYTEDMKTFSPVNVVGQINSESSELDKIKDVRRGSMVTIRFDE
ncbi:MAG: cyclophilin-like family protein [Candidatus Thorarchaeota archaeon]